MTIEVILDASFLLVPPQLKVDIFEGMANLLKRRFEPILLSTTYEELQLMIEKGPPKVRRHASLALELSRRCRLVEVERSLDESYDDVIVRVAKERACLVATNDRTLKRRLRSVGITVVYLRQGSRLELEGMV